MRFLSRIMGFVPAASRARQERRSTGRRRSRIELETLEGRALMTGIAGVSVSYGNLLIQPTQASGNTAVVSIAPDQNLQVTLNGQSEEFSPSAISSITYYGGSGGGDSFTNATNLTSLEYGYGSGNNFTGGTGFNYAFFYYGSGNTFNAQGGSVNDVFEVFGSDAVNNPDNALVQVYSY
jgi:hypothetical protein